MNPNELLAALNAVVNAAYGVYEVFTWPENDPHAAEKTAAHDRLVHAMNALHDIDGINRGRLLHPEDYPAEGR